MRVVVVTQYYAPEPVPLARSLAQGLAQRGHEVTVVTGFPNYPQGRLYPGYRVTKGHVEQDGPVTVHRVPLVISHSRNPVGRVLNYLSFARNSRRAVAAAAGADVVYSYATQMTASIGPDRWSSRYGLPHVMHVQDLWPESVTGSNMVGGSGVQSLIARILGPWLRGLYRRATRTIAIGPTMANLLVERGVPADRIESVYNWSTAPGARPGRLAETSGTRVMFAGNMGEMQDLESIVRAAALVRDVKGLEIVFVGSGVAERSARALTESLELENVSFLGRVAHDEMAEHYATSDFQLVTLRDLPIFRATLPSKFQASLWAGVPVITNVAGDVADLVDEHGVGYVARPGDVGSLADALRRAADSSAAARAAMSSRATRLYDERLSAERAFMQIERILLDAIDESRTIRKGGRPR